MRRPLEGPVRVTSDTYEHALRGVGPATDYAAPTTALPIGTPVVAPFAFSRVLYWGKADNPKGYPGGLAVNLYSPDGRFIFVGQHLSRYAYNTQGPAGTVVAYSGNTGASTGPHLHCYVIADGVRMSMEEALAEYGGEIAGGGTDLPTEPKEWDEMATEDEIRAVVRDEIQKAIRDIAGGVWGYSMNGGDPTDPNKVPQETAGERLRNVRRSTAGLKGRTVRIEDAVTE